MSFKGKTLIHTLLINEFTVKVHWEPTRPTLPPKPTEPITLLLAKHPAQDQQSLETSTACTNWKKKWVTGLPAKLPQSLGPKPQGTFPVLPPPISSQQQVRVLLTGCFITIPNHWTLTCKTHSVTQTQWIHHLHPGQTSCSRSAAPRDTTTACTN